MGDEALFAHNVYAGRRYFIVAKQAANTLDGKIIEVLLHRTPQPVDTLALFTSLYRGNQNSHLTAPAQGEGYVFLYSANYQYLTGRHFEQGQFLPGNARLVFQLRPGTTAVSSAKSAGVGLEATTNMAPPIGAPCLDWCSGETGKYITTTGDCSGLGSGGSGDVPPVYTGGGGPCGGNCGGVPGPGGYGGGGAVPTALDPNVVLLTPPNHIIQNVPDHLKCFNKSQGAIFSVYATQPKPGTRATWSGSIGDPNVGHTFISISQGGITRVIGFYPAAGVTPNSPSSPSTLADDSDHDYSVRINMPLTGTQLTAVLNYILSYSGTHNLNSYNCTDFGIGAAGAAGLTLPATRGTWLPGSGGLNPGDLGQDMRTMSLPTGASRDTQNGQADSYNGGC